MFSVDILVTACCLACEGGKRGVDEDVAPALAPFDEDYWTETWTNIALMSAHGHLFYLKRIRYISHTGKNQRLIEDRS